MSFLEQVVASTNRRVAEGKAALSADVLEQRVASLAPPRDFSSALAGPGVAIIAEIKRATPSAGELAPDVNPSATARAYARGGAAAISVLTEPEFFRGSLDDLEKCLDAGLPVLRKEFVLDPWQVLETRAAGADAVLLIARVVREQLGLLMRSAEALGLHALVEVYDDADLDAALNAGASIIGVNHRDLDTFEVDPDRTARLAPRVPEGVALVALSGVSTRADVKSLESAGATAVLVGEVLVRATDPEAKLRELRGES